ncbi:unnamed protein product [Lactuca saligna]|uniref:Dirigent protein n=1 Tax=Lactuca saligna TaxID=75948 RepID=A0AA35ZCG6_LACSI|nr:unnamed protein product [Lactuca saligna]
MATSVSKSVTVIFSILLLSFFLTVESQKFSRNLSQRSLGLRKEKLSHFRFYFHDIVSGPNATAIRIVEATRTNRTASTGFGDISMIDNPLTIGPERNSSWPESGDVNGERDAGDRRKWAFPLSILSFSPSSSPSIQQSSSVDKKRQRRLPTPPPTQHLMFLRRLFGCGIRTRVAVVMMMFHYKNNDY